MKDVLYHLLGIPKGATDAQIKKAYRDLSKIHHPDRGGDADTFARLTLAYDVLMDPERRAQYDATGEIPDSSQLHDAITTKAMEMINRMLFEALAADDDLAQRQLLKMMLDGMERLLEEANKKMDNHKRIKGRIERYRPRWSKKKGIAGPNRIDQAMGWQIWRQDHEMKKVQADLDVYKRVIEVLNEHEWMSDASIGASVNRRFGGLELPPEVEVRLNPVPLKFGGVKA